MKKEHTSNLNLVHTTRAILWEEQYRTGLKHHGSNSSGLNRVRDILSYRCEYLYGICRRTLVWAFMRVQLTVYRQIKWMFFFVVSVYTHGPISNRSYRGPSIHPSIHFGAEVIATFDVSMIFSIERFCDLLITYYHCLTYSTSFGSGYSILSRGNIK